MMFESQLMIDELTCKIIDEPIKYWKCLEEVPSHIKNFIKVTAKSRIIHDSTTKKYHCPTCLSPIDNGICNSCNRKYIISQKYISKSEITVTSINEIDNEYDYCYCHVFDIVNGQVLLYLFEVSTYYTNHVRYMATQVNDIEIKKVYHVKEKGIKNLLTNESFSFEEYSKYQGEDKLDSKLYEEFEFYDIYPNFIYEENLHLLKQISFYRYTAIWNQHEYFNINNFSLFSLTYYPICFKQYEYLVKMKLYCLANYGSDIVSRGNNFEDRFGINKKYYTFMKSIDITPIQLEALRIFPTKDIKLLNYICNHQQVIEYLSKYIKLDKLMKYIEKQNLGDDRIYEYLDYIKGCESLKLNLRDSKVLFPNNLMERYNQISYDVITSKNPDINNKIHSLESILKLNCYEDERYIIFPADSVESLIDESSQQSNCVRRYCDDMSKGKCQIYFLRYKNSPKKSLITIEVRDGKIVQAKARFNLQPSKEIDDVLKVWQNRIIPIVCNNN